MSYRTLVSGVVVLALIAGVIVAACGGKAASTAPAPTPTTVISKASVEQSTADETMKKDEASAIEKKEAMAKEEAMAKDEVIM